MAEILKTYNFQNGLPPYPWEEWLDGQIRRLKHGVDFKIDVKHFQISAHVAAKARHLRMQTRTENGSAIVIQAVARKAIDVPVVPRNGNGVNGANTRRGGGRN